MSRFKGWRARLHSLVRGGQAEARMEEEFRFHLEMEVERNLRAGMGAEAARRRALLSFGGIDRQREAMREGRGVRWLDDLVRDARVGVRGLRRSPGFTVTTLLTIACGVGATTAVFSAVDAALLRPLPFVAPERLVEVDVGIPFGDEDFPESAPDILDVRAQTDVFTRVAAYAPGGVNLSGVGAPRRIRVGVVTPDLFATLGVAPVLGRGFTSEEGERGGPAVAVLSYGLWASGFGADPDVTGRVVTLNGKAYAIAGVMPRGFAFPEEAEVWLPLTVPATFESFEYFRQSIPSHVVARLAPDVSVDQAEARLAVLSARSSAGQDPAAGGLDQVWPLRQSLVGGRQAALIVLLGATALVLLVACANVAHLLLARAVHRRREIALRTILGASATRVLRQFLTESTLLAVAGGLLGVAVAFAIGRALDVLIPAPLSGVAPIRLDARVLGFAVLITLATGLAFGLWPALEARHAVAGDALRSGASSAGASAGSARRVFVVAELALALMLLIGSALMLRSLHSLLSSDTAVQPERVATLELTLADADYPTQEARRAFYVNVLERLRSSPEVEAAAAINELPLRGVGGVRFLIYPEGRRPDDPDVRNMAQDLRITEDYFHTMGIPIFEGRPPRSRPDTLAPREVAISRSLAELYWPGRSPIGQRLLMPNEMAFEVVGVVADVRPRSLESEPIPQAYYSLLDVPYDNAAIVARGRVPAALLTGRLQEAVRAVAPHQAVYNVRTMEQVIAGAITPRRTSTVLITAFGALALVLATIGVYGVMSFTVARRTREIGIRMALGAHPSRVRTAVVHEGLKLALIGVLIGLFGAWMLARVLAGLVYGVSPHDPIAFSAAPVILLSVATLAALIPARRATLIDPMIAIRAE